MYDNNRKLVCCFILTVVTMMSLVGNAVAQEAHEVIWDTAVNPDGSRIAVAESSGNIEIYDDIGNVVQTLSAHLNATIAVAWSPDGKLLASGGMDNALLVWNTQDWSQVRQIRLSSNEIYHLSWQPGGNILIGSSFDTFFAWDTSTWTMLIDPMNVTLTDLEWSPDGASFAFTASPTAVGIGAFKDNDLDIQIFDGHLSTPYSVAWSPNSKRIVSAGGKDGTVRLWDVENGIEIAKLLEMGTVATDAIYLNSKFVAASTSDGDVYIIDVDSGKAVETYSLDTSVRSLAWNSYTKNLIIATEANSSSEANIVEQRQADSLLVFQEVELDDSAKSR